MQRIETPGTSRRTRARRAGAVTAVGAVIAAAAAFGGGASGAAAADEVTFTVGLTNEVDSFNPFNGIEAESYEMWALTYDYMITFDDEDMSPEPGLAESWDTSEDGLTWTFHIRTGVMWSDGEPLTASDIAYTYNRILDGGPEAPTWRSYLASIDTITAPDDETVELKLSTPNAVLPLLPIPIVPEHVWKDVSEDEVKSFPNEPEGEDQPVVGSGPFRLIEGAAGGSIYRFVPNPDYWQGTPAMDELVFRVYRSEDTMIQALKAGDIDFAEGITALQVKALEGQPGITAQDGDSPGFDEIAFNVGSEDPKTGEPLGDPNPAVLNRDFRFALNFAIDRQAIVDKAYQGSGDPATTIIPTAYSQWQLELPPEDFAYDPEKAKELLDEAGFTVGDDGFRTMPDGTPIGKLRLHARSDSEASLSTMNFMQEWLKDVDIDSEVIAVESSKLTNIILDGEFDLFQWGWYVEPDPDSILSYFTCAQRGGWSDSWYCNDEYDALYEQQHSELNVEARQEIVKQMQQMLYDDMPYLVTAYSGISEAYRSDRWEGFVPQPNPGGVLLIQYGIANYLNIHPVSDSEAAGSSGDGGASSGQVIGIAAAVVVAIGVVVGGAALFRRSRADERE